MKLDHLLGNWRPGSYDWSWIEEFVDVMAHERTAFIRKKIEQDGIGFLDSISPVLLGNDGRVWDGHHRICLAKELGIDQIEVELT